MTSRFHIYVSFTAADGKIAELEKALSVLAKASLATEVCVGFEVTQSAEDPRVFKLFESFVSKSEYPKHYESAHVKLFLNEQVADLVSDRSAFFLEDTDFPI
jgi:quinol monooxygenase YgiN